MENALFCILFAKREPVTIDSLCKYMAVDKIEIHEMVNRLNKVLKDLPLAIIDSGESLQMVAKNAFSPLIESLISLSDDDQISTSLLSVLSIVAYAGPISRDDISILRGVNSNLSIRNLERRGLIQKADNTYSLTIEALNYYKITNSSELPEYENIRENLNNELNNLLEEVA